MQGQYGNTTIIEIVQEDFVETPGGNAVVEVLDDTEGVGEAGLIRNVPSVILSHISFDMLSDISSDILSNISCDMLSNISSDILSDISCDMLSDKTCDILSDI